MALVALSECWTRGPPRTAGQGLCGSGTQGRRGRRRGTEPARWRDARHKGIAVSKLSVPWPLCYYSLLSQSCVAQRQSIRLLIGRLLVRIQSQEQMPRVLMNSGLFVDRGGLNHAGDR